LRLKEKDCLSCEPAQTFFDHPAQFNNMGDFFRGHKDDHCI
jgi:hypothetical protein